MTAARVEIASDDASVAVTPTADGVRLVVAPLGRVIRRDRARVPDVTLDLSPAEAGAVAAALLAAHTDRATAAAVVAECALWFGAVVASCGAPTSPDAAAMRERCAALRDAAAAHVDALRRKAATEPRVSYDAEERIRADAKATRRTALELAAAIRGTPPGDADSVAGWTRDVPTAPGWYAVRAGGTDPALPPELARVWRSGGPAPEWCVEFAGEGLPLRLVEVAPGWWLRMPDAPEGP